MELQKSPMDATLIEDGVWTDVLYDGEAVYKGGDKSLPWRVKVRSLVSKAHRDNDLKQRQTNQTQLTKARGTEVRKRLSEKQQEASQGQWFASVLMCTENMDVSKAGQVIPTKDEALAMSEAPEWQWLVQFVCAFSATGSNYGVADENPIKGDDEKPTDDPA